jgi:hypothetical protein
MKKLVVSHSFYAGKYLSMENKVGHFLSLVKYSPRMRNVFNPWRDIDREKILNY